MHRSRAAPSKQHATLATNSAEGKALALENEMPMRRVTRSQSREIEGSWGRLRTGQYGGTSDGRKTGKDGDGEDAGLEAVAEEPTLVDTSPQKPRSRPDRRSLGSREDPMNMSGTTMVPLESEPDSDADPDPTIMAETLPTLEHSSKRVLDSLLRHSNDALDIVNGARSRMQDKRFRYQVNNLNREMKHFGNMAYIDVDSVADAVRPVLEEEGTESSLEPTLHRANCARLALETLLASNSESRRSVITGLEGRFPGPFTSDLMPSAVERATFDLALEIRTQFLMSELEAHEEDDRDPMEILNGVFYDEVMDEDDEPALRGFSLAPFEDVNGRLPERFWDAVAERIDDIRASLADGDDAQALKTSYPWRKFCLRTVRWIWRMVYSLERQSVEENSRLSLPRDGFDGTADSTRISVSRTQRWSTVQPTPVVTPSKKGVALSTQARESAQPTSPTLAKPAPAEQTTQPSSAKPAQSKEPEPGRRKSNKGPFLNPATIERLKERQQPAETHTASTSGVEPRRQTFAALPRAASREILSESQGRRQTLAAPLDGRQDIVQPTQSYYTGPFHDPSDDELFVNESLDLDEPGAAVEMSQSPAPNRTAKREASPPTQEVNNDNPYSAENIWAIADENRKDSTRPSATQVTLPSPSTPGGRAATQRRFIDHQANARRISSIDGDSDTQSSAPQNSAPSNKRMREEIEDSDDDFASDTRTIDTASKRQQKPIASPSKRRRLQRDSHDASANQLQQGLDESAQPQPRPNEPTAPGSPPITSRTRHDDTRHSRSRIISGMRKRWTTKEDDALIEYIRDYACAWAQIEAVDSTRSKDAGGEKLGGRSQAQIKDRARNLRNKLLRDGMRWEDLPTNFNKITLGTRDLDQIGSHAHIPDYVVEARGAET